MPCATARTWSPWMITLISHRQAGLEVPRLTLDGQVVQDRNARTGGRRALDAVVTVVELLGTDRDRDGVVGRIGVGVNRIGRRGPQDPAAAQSRPGVNPRGTVGSGAAAEIGRAPCRRRGCK